MLKKILILLSLLIMSLNVFAADNPQVRISTSKGNIDVELNLDKAPESVKNFMQYVNDDFYSGTIFHRVIKGFMIQGGGFSQDLKHKKTKQPIANEAFNKLKNDRGTIAMARTNDPHSATAQFFINTVNNDFLNHQNKSTRGWGYTVFGKVIKGMDVVDSIENSKTGPKGMFRSDVPLNDIIIQKVEIIKK